MIMWYTHIWAHDDLLGAQADPHATCVECFGGGGNERDTGATLSMVVQTAALGDAAFEGPARVRVKVKVKD